MPDDPQESMPQEAFVPDSMKTVSVAPTSFNWKPWAIGAAVVGAIAIARRK